MQRATDRCQILRKNSAPSKELDAQAYLWHATAFDSTEIHAQRQPFLLPTAAHYATRGAQHNNTWVAGSFQWGC